jgi:hypothetical protein
MKSLRAFPDTRIRERAYDRSHREEVAVARITVLDPTAAPPDVDPDPGPDAGDFAGRIVGIRSDRTWPSFEWVLDEWTRELSAAGAQVRPWRAGNRIGDDGVRTFAELDDFATDVDIAVIGLGN